MENKKNNKKYVGRWRIVFRLFRCLESQVVFEFSLYFADHQCMSDVV